MAENHVILDAETNKWLLPIEVTEAGQVDHVMQTAGTYVDKDIEVKVTVADATYEVESNEAPVAVASIADNNFTTESETRYAITLQADATKAASVVGVDQAGFAAADDTVTVPATTAEQATKVVYIKEGELGGQGTAGAESASVKLTKTTADGEGFIIKASGAGNVAVTKAGWVDPENTTAVSTDGDAYYEVQKASLTNVAKDGATYSEVEGPVLTSGGYLYINEGYVKDSKISLADLIPDEANITDENADLVYNTVKAYDKDGALIVGTMGDAELGAISASDASATIETVVVTANEDGSKFNVAGTKAIEGSASVAVVTRGLATTDMKATGAIEGEAAVEAELDVIALAVEVKENEGSAVEIAKGESTAKSSEILDAAPSDRAYITVSVADIVNKATVAPKVTAEGYGTSTVASKAELEVSSNITGDSAIIAIDNGDVVSTVTAGEDVEEVITVTADKSASASTINLGGVLTAAPTDKPYITLSAESNAPKATITGSVKTDVTEGYVLNTKSNTKDVVANFSTTAGSAAQYIRVWNGECL